ncbi:universal stress protein YxiE-like [Panicum miliaceum]|uniref:Universal stress protein YxiE-like n=1 Tax=Panicum miliaceum TaxID=4540 RepID=A0A3L6Q1W8_PANMI|nr:universal stress protein YxiE-like [Panicum miliaceum]
MWRDVTLPCWLLRGAAVSVALKISNLFKNSLNSYTRAYRRRRRSRCPSRRCSTWGGAAARHRSRLASNSNSGSAPSSPPSPPSRRSQGEVAHKAQQYRLVVVTAKPSAASVVGLAGLGADVLPFVEADLKRTALRVIEMAKELCTLRCSSSVATATEPSKG